MTRYHHMLKGKIREFMIISSYETLYDLVEASTDMELVLEAQQRKHKQDQVHVLVAAIKKIRVVDARLGDQGILKLCGKCGLAY